MLNRPSRTASSSAARLRDFTRRWEERARSSVSERSGVAGGKRRTKGVPRKRRVAEVIAYRSREGDSTAVLRASSPGGVRATATCDGSTKDVEGSGGTHLPHTNTTPHVPSPLTD
jgi:hypothetical protein